MEDFPDEEDMGWVFNPEGLSEPGDIVPATVYMKFQINTSIPKDTNYFNADGSPRSPLDDETNWKAVNSHTLRIRIGEVRPQEGADTSGPLSDYVTLLDASGQPAESVEVTTSGNGAAEVKVKAGPLILQAGEIILDGVDTTIH